MSEEKKPQSQMLINYVPGEECRVAIADDGKLEELHVERVANASRVGNIYVGKVMNVEAAIQAAFVDFGVGENGFLHVTDLHPRYFPGEDDETTERVGIKTPRRERPPIQHALRRGDEIIVQVLKEGVGTKGPTLTSYLSIPGRFLVMMPHMDNIGVSRKVEDEDLRRRMREILDQLELPEGFGFILRTAGMERNKAELKRDLSYLQRLWKDMDKRLKAGGKPRLLYSESDLLVRALRDIVSNDTSEIVIDNEAALKRAARFLKIVAPRTSTKLLHYQDKAPLFHAYGMEQQIALIHAREVPLPSGGRLVIDQTEALVAIDVNSGKSRESRNSEDNAYQTNLEAVDEICRQLRLRDMGGIVINDLIDMRHSHHRKDIENRFKERLKRDRAKTTVLAISEFGILEMTRQRMRPSHESVHFSDCPICRGRGMLQKPDSVASDGLRELAALLDVERVQKVEMVVSPRVAGDLLSGKRQLLGRVERTYGKHVDVRVSESVPVDRVSFYAYDESGADIDISNLPKPRKPKDVLEWVEPEAAAGDWAAGAEEDRAIAEVEAEPLDETQEMDVHPIEVDLPPEDGADWGTTPTGAPAREQGERGGRRRRRGGRGRGGREGSEAARPVRSGPAPAPVGPGGVRPGHGEDRPMRGERRYRGGPPGGRDRPRREERPIRDDTDEWGEPVVRPAPVAREAHADVAPRIEPPTAPIDGPDAGVQPAGGPGLKGDGEGGERRGRRRRRRRGRGRGGRGDSVGGPPGEPGAAEPPVDDRERAPVPMPRPSAGVDRVDEWGEPVVRAPQVREAPMEPAQGQVVSDDADAEVAPGPEGGATGDRGGEAPAGGGRRRRRRRRGGRGRGGAQAGGPEGGPEARAEGPQSPSRVARSDEPRREAPPRETPPREAPLRQTPPPPPQREVKPAQVQAKPAAQSKPPAQIKTLVRSLYGNVRRKLAPGELPKRPKDE